MLPRVKICCISSSNEAQMAINHGASAIGLVGKMPSGPGPIADELIKEIARTVPPPIATFLLTSETDAHEIISHHYRTNTNTIQIVDELTNRNYQTLRKEIPNVKLVQVIHVIDDSSVEAAIAISDHVDALLLDSGNPKLKIKELGGTGRTHNWKLSRQIVEKSKVPVLLAGGLTHENVYRAIQEVQPFGVDVCSGVRTHGMLDPYKMELFFKEIYRSD
jgi:Phosphoribosylanthranilate isomerase